MESLPPQKNAEIVLAHYDLVGPPGSFSELSFCAIGDPIRLVYVGVDNLGQVIPQTTGGFIAINELLFVRGDTDGNGMLNPIVDALFLFSFQFVPGSPSPTCLEAADVDGDSGFNGLLDGLFLLNSFFVPGAPTPTAPYPTCGVDPDPLNHLGCLEFPGCG